MIFDFLKDNAEPLVLLSVALGIIGILIKLGITVYTNWRTDKKEDQATKSILLAEERAKYAESTVELINDLHDRFIKEYKDLSLEYKNSNNLMVQAIEGNKQSNIGMQHAIEQFSKINDKLGDSVDRLKDTITNNLIKITS